jgi:hypothetical protein
VHTDSIGRLKSWNECAPSATSCDSSITTPSVTRDSASRMLFGVMRLPAPRSSPSPQNQLRGPTLSCAKVTGGKREYTESGAGGRQTDVAS